MDDSDLETLSKLLDDYADVSREVMDRFRSVEDRLAAVHHGYAERRNVVDEVISRQYQQEWVDARLDLRARRQRR